MKLASCSLKLVALLGTLYGATQIHAKDLAGRTGIGLSNIGAQTTEAVSLDWQATRATGFEVNLGLATKGDNGGWDLGFRASRNLFIEDNMLFSLFVGGAVIQEKTAGLAQTGYSIEAGLGSKFFLEGLPNLGFGFRGALQLMDVGDLVIQVAPIFDIHYYF